MDGGKRVPVLSRLLSNLPGSGLPYHLGEKKKTGFEVVVVLVLSSLHSIGVEGKGREHWYFDPRYVGDGWLPWGRLMLRISKLHGCIEDYLIEN